MLQCTVCQVVRPTCPTFRPTISPTYYNFFTMPESIYKLVSRISRRYMLRFGIGRMPGASSSGSMIADNSPDPSVLCLMDVCSASKAEASDAAAPPKVIAQVDEDKADWAKRNAKARVKHFTYTESRPLASMQRVRMMLECMRVLYQHEVYLASEEFELDQLGAIASAKQRGLPTRGVRNYKLQLGARMEGEQLLHEQLSKVYTNETQWSVVPVESRTMAYRCKSFRMSSRIGCSAEWHLARKHTSPDEQMFLLAGNPSPELRAKVYDTMLSEPICFSLRI